MTGSLDLISDICCTEHAPHSTQLTPAHGAHWVRMPNAAAPIYTRATDKVIEWGTRAEWESGTHD